MTQQEQFEKDYLEAFELCDNGTQFWWVYNAAQYYDEHHQIAFEVWLQQAKRHEVEIAELVKVLRVTRRDMVGHPDNVALLDATIAKYEVKNK